MAKTSPTLVAIADVLTPAVKGFGRQHDVRMEISINHYVDDIILGAYCETGAYQGLLLSRSEIEDNLPWEKLIRNRLEHALSIVRPRLMGDEEYNEIMRDQDAMANVKADL